jgi:hypothetical protein
MIRSLLTIIHEDRAYREMVMQIVGYDISDMGAVIYKD